MPEWVRALIKAATPVIPRELRRQQQRRHQQDRGGHAMKTPAEELRDDLVFMLIEEKSVHEEERLPLDRTHSVDHAVNWLKDRDPKGRHRRYIVQELRRMTGPDRDPDADYYLEESLLQRLEAEAWFRGTETTR